VSPDQIASAGRLYRVVALTKASVIVTAVLIALSVASQALQWLVIEDARRLIDGRITDDEFIAAFGPSALLQVLAGAAQITLGILTLVLWFRIARNLRALGRDTRWGPGWTIGGWFVPPLVLYIIPFLTLREMWRASDPDVAWGSQHQSWKASSVPGVITAWWVLFGLVPLAVLGLGRGASTTPVDFGGTDLIPLAEQIADQWMLSTFSTVASVAAAACWITILRGLTGRHRAFTGE
jgi:hypothetical protein